MYKGYIIHNKLFVLYVKLHIQWLNITLHLVYFVKNNVEDFLDYFSTIFFFSYFLH